MKTDYTQVKLKKTKPGFDTVILCSLSLLIMLTVLILSLVLINYYHKSLREVNLQTVVEMSFVTKRLIDSNENKHQKFNITTTLDELSTGSEQYLITDHALSNNRIYFNDNNYNYSEIRTLVINELHHKATIYDFSIYLSHYNKWLNIKFPPPILGTVIKAIIIFEAILALIILYFVITSLRFAGLWQQMLTMAEYYSGNYNTKIQKHKLFLGSRVLFSSIAHMKRVLHRLKELSAQKSFIITALTHNIRTPITRAELLLEIQQDTPEKDKILEELDEINKQVTQIAQYTKSTSILDLADDINLYHLIEKIHQKTPEFEIHNAINTDLIIYAQPFAIELAINNLIDNAIKYASQLTIKQTNHKESTEIMFISEIDRDKSHMHYESTGIGIQISDILLKQNSCQLLLEKTKNQYIATMKLPPII